MKNKCIFLVSSAIGMAGGADKATKLLADEYVKLGYQVVAFTTSCEIPSNHKNLKICTPLVNKGHRFSLPQRSLIIRLFFASLFTKPMFVHCIGLTMEVRLVLKFLSRLKVVVWETTEAKPKNRFVDPQIIPLLKRANLMIAPSKIIRENIIKTYQYKGNIEILPFWIEWKFDNSQKIHHRTNKILYIGRLDTDKGFDCLFSALRLIKNDLNIHVDICGRGNQKLIEEMCSDLDNVFVHGWTEENKVEALTREADYMILPSKHEGYPLSLIEACSNSKPIIASSVGSIPEVFGNNPCALIFNVNDAMQLAEIIKKAYVENDDAYHQRCIEARRIYEILNNPIAITKNLNQLILRISVSES